MVLRLGTRGSMLAQTQSRMVAAELEKRHRELSVELVICKTSGDRIVDRPLYEEGGKGLFTKELEEALLADKIDFAVHSFKDVPVTMPLVEQDSLIIIATPPREDPADAIISMDGKSIDRLLDGAKVGTGSLRRRCQLLAMRPDLKIEGIRGNIDSRINKLRNGQYDAVILAMAGLKRSGLLDPTMTRAIPVNEMIPAAAQGTLAIQCRKNDDQTRKILRTLDDPATRKCVDLERSLVAALNGDCHSPIAALATIKGAEIRLQAAIGARGGELPVIRAEAVVEARRWRDALDEVMKQLEKQNVRELLS